MVSYVECSTRHAGCQRVGNHRTTSNPQAPLTLDILRYRPILRQAWPIILANAAVPLLGLADTAVIGNTGRTADLGAIALGALIFSFLFWSFGFLRMGTTGFVAQASGAGDEPEVRAALLRALFLGLGIGLALLALQALLASAAFGLLEGSQDVEQIARDYFRIRVWGAPATLALFVCNGLFIGLGRSRTLLLVQVLLNGLNIVLDVLFAGWLDWGVPGIALGTAVAEWTVLGVALWLVTRLLRERQRDAEPFWPWDRVRHAGRLLRTLGANSDIMVRTLFLLFGFAWFTNQAARFGDVTLAANHILLQLVSFAAFFLDGYAFVAESLVGSAIGAGRRSDLDHAVRVTSELAALTAVALALVILACGPVVVRGLTDLPIVRGAANHYLPLAALYVLVAFPAFQLDGVFIGATCTREMRNASVASVIVFLGAWWLVGRATNTGLWASFIVYVVARSVMLGLYLPGVGKRVRGGRGT